MLLAIDVGNTHTVLGAFTQPADGGAELVEHWRVSTEARRSADELALLVRGLLAQRTTELPATASITPAGTASLTGSLTGIVVCSTVPAVLREMRAMCRRHFPALPSVIVEPGVRTGVPILTDNPKEVGTDRIVNTLAAHHLYGGPTVVVDFGTSTNFDVVSAKGEFLGGAIAPGIAISVDALAARGAQLHKVELARPRAVIGKNTVECLQSGILYGFAGQVDGLVERIVDELGAPARVIATGGLAPLVLAESRRIECHEPWLTLVGLRLVFEKNVGPGRGRSVPA